MLRISWSIMNMWTLVVTLKYMRMAPTHEILNAKFIFFYEGKLHPDFLLFIFIIAVCGRGRVLLQIREILTAPKRKKKNADAWICFAGNRAHNFRRLLPSRPASARSLFYAKLSSLFAVGDFNKIYCFSSFPYRLRFCLAIVDAAVRDFRTQQHGVHTLSSDIWISKRAALDSQIRSHFLVIPIASTIYTYVCNSKNFFFFYRHYTVTLRWF